jgi:PAS domain S-box-containing protein
MDLNTHSKKLAHRLFLIVIAFSLLATLLITGIHCYFDYRTELADADRVLQQIGDSYQHVIIDTLWKMDRSQVELLLQGICQSPYIQFAKIEHQGGIIAQSGAKPSGPGRVRLKEFKLNYSYKNQDVPLGVLHLESSHGVLWAKALSNIGLTLAYNSIIVLFVAIFVYWVFQRLVIQHLSFIAQRLQDVRAEDTSTPLVLHRKSKPDELENLVQSINTMQDRLLSDLSERKRAEQEIVRLKNFYETILESIIDGVWVTDRNDVIYYANKGMGKIAGLSPQKIAGANLLKDFPEKTMQFFKAYYLQAKETLLPIYYDAVIMIIHSGQKTYQSGWLIPMLQEGAYLGMICTAQDITARRQAEESIQRLSQQNQLILHAAGEGIIGLDLEGRVTFINPAATAKTGFTPEEIIGKELHAITHHTKTDGSPYPLNECPIHQPLQARSTQRVRDALMWKKDGTSFPAAFSSTPMMENGEIIGAVVIFRDITERKEAEQARARLEAQLFQAQKMEALGTLAGGIAHDFNNILSVILGYTDMALLNVTGSEQLSTDLKQVFKAGQRAKELVKQILAFSRQGQQERLPLQISPIIKEAMTMLRASLPTTIEIRTKLQSDGVVLADPTGIHQILMNLCTNAAHAMRHQGGILEIILLNTNLNKPLPHPELSPGKHIKLSVIDTGHGMPPEMQKRIFDPFFTTKTAGEGTGLGLSVVHGIVKNHQGAITVYSEPGQGTTFNVYLPCVTGEAIVETEPNLLLAFGKERILLVDDEKVIIELGKQMLEHLGYEVEVFNSSMEALQAFQAHPDKFDLVITDQTMPRMTGGELAREILTIRPDLPIILCTGFSESITAEKARDIGIKAFVMKPLVIQELAKTIRRVLDNREK